MAVHYFEVFGQHIATAQAWYSYSGSDNVTIKDESGTYSYGGLSTYRMIMYSIEDAVPFNILTYFMQKYNNDLTQFIHGVYYEAWNLETGEQVSWDGSETGLYDRIFYIGYTYDGTHNSIHFVGGFGSMQAPGRITTAHGRLGYNGMSLDTGPNGNDIRMAELYIIKYLENDDFEEMDAEAGDTYYPDWTRGHANSEGAYTFPRGEGYRGCMNGCMYCEFNDTYYFFNTSGISFIQDPLEIVTTSEVIMTSPYYGGGWWWGPDPRTAMYYSKYYRPNMYATDWNAPWWSLDELDFFIPEEVEPEGDEPEGGDGTSSGGGGGGRNNYHTDSNPDTNTWMNTQGFLESGAGLIYQPSASERFALSKFLWSEYCLDNFSQVTTPIEAILNLMFIPVDFSTLNCLTTAGPIALGNMFVRDPDDMSLVTASLFNQSCVRVDCGYVNLGKEQGEQFGNAFDYSPYTEIHVYIPYVGMVQIDPNDAFVPTYWSQHNSKLELCYYINVATGEAVARLSVTKTKPNKNMSGSDGEVTYLIGQYSCNMGYKVPITGANFSAYNKNNLQSMIGAVGGAVMGVGGGMMGNPFIAGQGVGQMLHSGANLMGLNDMVTMPSVMKSGSVTGGSSQNNYYKASVFLIEPHAVMDDEDYETLEGLPASFSATTLSTLQNADLDKCYFEIESVRTNGFSGTSEEEAELVKILQNGVYLNTASN